MVEHHKCRVVGRHYTRWDVKPCRGACGLGNGKVTMQEGDYQARRHGMPQTRQHLRRQNSGEPRLKGRRASHLQMVGIPPTWVCTAAGTENSPTLAAAIDTLAHIKPMLKPFHPD